MIRKQKFVEKMPVDRLAYWEPNPNQGDIGAIAMSIEANGFYGALVVQEGTNRVVAGNHRLAAARQLGITTVPVIFVEGDDEDMARLNLVDNRTARLGHDDEAMLAEILTSLAPTEMALAGTGYDGDDLDRLLADLRVDDEVPAPAKKERWRVSVDVDDEETADKAVIALGDIGLVASKEAK